MALPSGDRRITYFPCRRHRHYLDSSEFQCAVGHIDVDRAKLPARDMIRQALRLAALLAITQPNPSPGQTVKAPLRQAVVIAFDDIPNDLETSGASAPNVTAAMLADFAGKEGSRLEDATRLQSRDRAPGPVRGHAFLRTPFRIPAWMNPGRSLTSDLGTAPSVLFAGRCSPDGYKPSGLLQAAAEGRRRVLYPIVVSSACRYGIPVHLFDAMIMQESRYIVGATSPKGAFGLGQLMPGTAAELGVDRFKIHENLDGAARYLASQLTEFGQPSLALAAYNAGPRRVRISGSIPRIAETQAYVRQILRNWLALERRGIASR